MLNVPSRIVMLAMLNVIMMLTLDNNVQAEVAIKMFYVAMYVNS